MKYNDIYTFVENGKLYQTCGICSKNRCVGSQFSYWCGKRYNYIVHFPSICCRFTYWKVPSDVRNVILNRTSLQIYFTGVQTLPLLLSIGLFFAAALMGAGYLNLRSLGAENHFGELLRIGVLGELGPLLTGLIVSARSGIAITADVGSMKIKENWMFFCHTTYLLQPICIA